MNGEDSQVLPAGWAWVTLGEVTAPSVVQEGPAACRDFLYVDISSVDNRSKRIVTPRLIPTAQAPSRARQHLRPGDVVVSLTRPNLNAVALVPKTMEGAIGSTGFHVLRAIEVLPSWLLYLVQADHFIGAMSGLIQGVLYPAVRPRDILSYRVPLAPLAEQRRIVAEIEKHFTRLDAAVAALKRAGANLKRYRAAVLKAACEGRLVPTEAELARAEGRDYEPAERLLARILDERRSRWEADRLEKTRPAGKVPNGSRWNATYQEPPCPAPNDLPQLPQGWTWAQLRSVAELKGGLTKGQKRRPSDVLRSVPYLRVANVQRGFLDLENVRQIEATEVEIEELRLRQGDVLFNEGGDRDKLGRGWLWRGELPECIHQNHVFRARLYTAGVQPKYLSWYGNSLGQQYFISQGRQTTNLASLNLTKLGELPVPLPPAAEQQRIVAEVERRLSVLDEMEAAIIVSLRRADRLRQAVLKRAFEGRLVPQDPEDEPASVLLERISAERNGAAHTHAHSRGKATRRDGADALAPEGEPVPAMPGANGAVATPHQPRLPLLS